MPFQSLREGSPLYILRKNDTPTITLARAGGVKQPYADLSAQSFAPYQQPSLVVDVTAIADGGENVNFVKLPALCDIADSGAGVVVACSRDAMCAEVENIRRISEGALATMDRHKATVAACDGILKTLRPEVAEREAKEAENAALRKELERLSRIVEGLAAREERKGAKSKANEGD